MKAVFRTARGPCPGCPHCSPTIANVLAATPTASADSLSATQTPLLAQREPRVLSRTTSGHEPIRKTEAEWLAHFESVLTSGAAPPPPSLNELVRAAHRAKENK